MATAHALMNHMYTVHKETLTKVSNAKPGREVCFFIMIIEYVYNRT